MDNLSIYNALRTPPKDALKAIQAGRLKGKTDISPQWRVEAMTNQFGPCGIGWRYEIVGFEESVSPSGEVALFCQINLFVKVDGEWSYPIPGTGGGMLVANERNGIYLDDDARKKALTDALSVAMKMLGVGADIYRGLADGKYQQQRPEANSAPAANAPAHIEALKTRAEELGLKEWLINFCQQTENLPNRPSALSAEQTQWVIGQMESHHSRLQQAANVIQSATAAPV